MSKLKQALTEPTVLVNSAQTESFSHDVSPPIRLAWTSAIWLLLIAVFAVAVYRAATQPIAHDESLEYTWFLDGGILNALRFNSTNHVLFTLLAKPCVKILGVSEFNLRLPALAGTVLYLIGGYFLTKELFGEGIVMFVSAALLSLNPTIMDFMAAARGYSLGLGFLIWALYLAARLLRDLTPDVRADRFRANCRLMSVLLALSVTANLTDLIPAACLVVLLFLVVQRACPGAFPLKSLVWNCTVPGVAVGFWILWPFLIQARPWQFAMGLHAGSDSLHDIFDSSFLYKWTGDIYSGSLGAAPLSPGSPLKAIAELGANVILPSIFVFVLIGVVHFWRMEPLNSRHATALLFGAIAVSSVILNWVLHLTIRMNYPVMRTGLYLIPLFTLAVILVAREISSRPRALWLRIVFVLVAAAVIADYSASLNTKYFRYNEYDAFSRNLFQTIYNDARSHDLKNVRIGGTWWYQPEIDFYTRRYHAAAIAPYEIVDRSYWWNTPDAMAPADYNYFVFTPSNDPHLAGPGFRVIFHDAATGITVDAHDN